MFSPLYTTGALGGFRRPRSTFIHEKFQLSTITWLIVIVLSGCTGPTPVASPADPVLQLERAFKDSRTDDMAEAFDYKGMLAERLGEVWSAGSPDSKARAIKQFHEMTIVTSREAAKNYLHERPTSLTVRYTTPEQAWVHVTTTDSPKNATKSATNTAAVTDGSQTTFTWRYRVLRRDGVWKIVQREYRAGAHSSRTMRFYRTVVGQLRKEFGRLPTLSEVVANVPSIARRIRVRTFRVPSSVELEEMRKKQSAAQKK